MTKSGFDFLQEGIPTPLAMSVCNIPSHHANRQGSMALEYKRTWMCIVLASLGRYLFLRTASYRSIGDEPAFLRRSPRVPFSVFSWPFENVANRQIHTTHASSVTTSTFGGNTDLKNPFVSGPLLPERECFRCSVTT